MKSKSQSALEYMMTYGWAILIIVIVAGVLYSLGIFNPSSSAGTTVTGFAGLGSVQAECIGGQGVSIQAGNSLGYPLQILNISVTSSGTTTILQYQQTISPNQNAVFYVPNVCTSTGSRYSLSVNVYYQELGQPFPGPYQSKGTIQGTTSMQSISSSPTIMTAVPITIINNQNTSTPSPFQQMVQVPSSVYSGYANLSGVHSFQNVEFFYGNGTIIPSWLENYSSINATYWLKLGSIPAGSSVQVYMGFTLTSANLFNSANDGEAPQISGTYGQYDDGANVFNRYWNFAGTLMPSPWTTTNATATVVNNGLTIKAAPNAFMQTTNLVNLMSQAVSADLNVLSYNGGYPENSYSIGVVQTASGKGYDVFSQNANGGSASDALVYYNGTYWYSFYTSQTTTYFHKETIYQNATNYFLYFNNALLTYGHNPSPPFFDFTNGYIILGTQPTGELQYRWILVRNILPNNAMPSVSFGQSTSITLPANVQTYYPITISNSQNVSVSNFQQMITVPFSVYGSYANLSGVHSFQNVEFFYSNGTIIRSWLENYTSSNAIYWTKLPSIPAYTSVIIYVGFVPKTTNLLNTANIGEAPQISGTYGQYDDGVNLFNFYDNFAGSSLSGKWSQTGNGTLTVNNGLNLSSRKGDTNIYLNFQSAQATSNLVVEAAMDFYGSSGTDIRDRTNHAWAGGPSDYGYYSTGGTGGVQEYFWSSAATGVNVPTASSAKQYNVLDQQETTAGGKLYWNSLSYPQYSLLYSNTGSLTSGSTYTSGFGATTDLGGSGTVSETYITFVRIRVYPPNGVMPSVSFGSIE